jgi:hypothetical protein
VTVAEVEGWSGVTAVPWTTDDNIIDILLGRGLCDVLMTVEEEKYCGIRDFCAYYSGSDGVVPYWQKPYYDGAAV